MKFHAGVAACSLAFSMACAAMTGCATLPPPPAGTPARVALAGSPFDDWLQRAPRHHSLQGVAKARVQTAERTVNGTQVILVEAPDRLRTEILSPFGSPLLVLAADGANLGVLLPGENLLYQGKATPDNLGRFTRLPLRLPELVGILLFRPPLIDYQDARVWLLPAGEWRVDLEAGPRRQLLTFDAGRRLREVRYLLQDELVLRLSYDRYSESQPDLPLQTELEMPIQQVQARLDYSEIACDRDMRPGIFTLQPPEGASVVLLDELPAPAEQADRAGNATGETGALGNGVEK